MAQRGRTRWLIMAVLTLAVVVASPTVAAAGGGGDDPYGPMTTDPPPSSGEVTCELSTTNGAPGETGTATVAGVGAGQTVRILIGGVEAGTGSAPAGPPGSTATVAIGFTVPELESDTYLVTAVSPTFTAECDLDFGVNQVAGVTIDNSGDGGGGTLPKTGIYVGVLVAIALALIVFGRAALAASRRSKRRAWAKANQVRRLTQSDVGPHS